MVGQRDELEKRQRVPSRISGRWSLRFEAEIRPGALLAGVFALAESYSTHFETGDTARKYETGEYAPGSYANLLWQIEQDQLRAIVAEMKLNQPHIEALDFASGTGRITALLENLVDAVTGIEISQSMCDIATKKVQCAESSARTSSLRERRLKANTISSRHSGSS